MRLEKNILLRTVVFYKSIFNFRTDGVIIITNLICVLHTRGFEWKELADQLITYLKLRAKSKCNIFILGLD